MVKVEELDGGEKKSAWNNRARKVEIKVKEKKIKTEAKNKAKEIHWQS